MHKDKQYVRVLQGGGLFSSILGALGGGGGSTASLLNQQIGAGLTGAFSAFAGIANANSNPNLLDTERSAIKGDSIANGLGTALSAVGPWGNVASLGLGLINGIGGSLMNNNSTAKAAKNFKMNDDVMGSSGYGGVVSQANDAKRGGDAYRKAGLFGKLFSNTSKIKGGIATSNDMQNRTADLLKTGRQAINDGIQSADLFATKNRNALYNTNMWTNGSIQMGQQGMKLPKFAPGQGQPQANPKPIGQAAQTQGQTQQVSPEQMEKMKINQGAEQKQMQAKMSALMDGTVMMDSARRLPKPKPADPKVNLAFNIQSKLPKTTPVATSVNTWPGGIYDLVSKALTSNTVVPMHKEGGAINVIVDGKLHAHKHAIKETEEFQNANLTSKGIPVVSKSEGGEITQHAEVEKNELILHIELTKKLEELLEDGSEEAMIEAGKLLSKEIVKNTEDSSDKIIENA